jgi:hypothetical protein
MKQLTCYDGNNLPTRLRGLSKRPWYSLTVPVCFNLAKSPKFSSNFIGSYLAYNPSLRLAYVIYPLVIDTKVGPHPLDDMLQEKSTIHLGYFSACLVHAI